MVTADVQEKRRRLLVRLGRHIPCNPPDLVKKLVDAAVKMLDNILKAPDDPKYRELRASNASVASKLLAPHGGKELLHLVGFEKILKHGEDVYFMAEVDPDNLAKARDWLKRQADTALNMAPAASPGATACAECVLQVRLTSGQTLEGGFFAHETLRTVYEFVRSSVINPEETVLLCAPGQGAYTEDKLDVTLMEAGLVPRAVLQVVKSGPTGSGAAEALEDARRRAKQEEADAAEQLRLVKERKLKEAAAKSAERERILSEFKHDREKAHGGGGAAALVQGGDHGFEETKGTCP